MKLSYEMESTLKILIFVFVVAVVVLYSLLSPIIFHKSVPYGVAAPKGQILLLDNVTLGNYSRENAVDLSQHLVLKGSENYGDLVVFELQTPGWCADVVLWNGSDYDVRETCTRKIEISKYLFFVSSSFYWYVERGYHLILYKSESPPENYELVNFTVRYGQESDWGAFKVAYPRE